jgi:hypothetical protein
LSIYDVCLMFWEKKHYMLIWKNILFTLEKLLFLGYVISVKGI